MPRCGVHANRPAAASPLPSRACFSPRGRLAKRAGVLLGTKPFYVHAMSRLPFTLQKEATGSSARATRFQTLHGEVQTPVFMPVGTQATVKGQTIHTLKATGSRVLLANTFHLLLRPGPEVFRKVGGIHRFMNWDGPVLTDSGGFQIFSLPGSRRMKEEGATFQSYVDGDMHLLSSDTSIG